VSVTPEPPPEGWTLPEAAAALFAGAWLAAWFPDDATGARAVPGIQPASSPWSQVPLDRMETVAAAVMAGGAISAGLETLVAACRAYEAEAAQRIAAAMVRRGEQRAALPGLLAARLAGGAFVARGISPRDPLRLVDIPALAWGAAEIALGWEEATWFQGSRPHTGWRAPPPPTSSVRLPGGITLLGVRVFAAGPIRDRDPSATPPAEAPPDEPDAYRTGAAGRPTSKQLVGLEHQRRLLAREAHQSVAQEARHLAAWLAARHPTAPVMSEGTVENAIRAEHRRATKSPTK